MDAVSRAERHPLGHVTLRALGLGDGVPDMMRVSLRFESGEIPEQRLLGLAPFWWRGRRVAGKCLANHRSRDASRSGHAQERPAMDANGPGILLKHVWPSLRGGMGSGLICVSLGRIETSHCLSFRRRGRPGGRIVDSNPSRFAVACCQMVWPNGVPTCAPPQRLQFGLRFRLIDVLQPILYGTHSPFRQRHRSAPVHAAPQAAPTPLLGRSLHLTPLTACVLWQPSSIVKHLERPGGEGQWEQDPTW